MLLFSNFLFFYFKAIFNLFQKAIQTILNLNSNHSINKSNAPACMHNHVAIPYDEFLILGKKIIFPYFMSTKFINKSF